MIRHTSPLCTYNQLKKNSDILTTNMLVYNTHLVYI